jgi:hypothetical protein
MKNKTKKLISTVVFLAFALPCLASASAIITDPFDTCSNGNLSGQCGWSGAGSGEYVVEDTDVVNGKAVHATYSTGQTIQKTGSETPDGTQTIHFKPASGSTYNRIYFRHLSGDTPVFEIRITNDTGLVQFKDGSNAVHDVGNLTPNVWGYIQVNWESTTKTYRLNVNGGAWSTAYTWRSTDNPDYILLELNNGDFYIDELGENPFSSTPPPTATADVTLADLYQKVTATPDTDAVFYINKSMSYGDVIIIFFAFLFLVFGVVVALWKFVFPFNFKK